MYIETLDAEYDAWSDDMNARMEHELRVWGVMCDICGDETRDSEARLRRDGWSLTPKGEICSDCVAERRFRGFVYG